MTYWGWRSLLYWFFSVLVVGCSSVTPVAPPTPPTEYPPVTLTVRRPISPTPPTPQTLVAAATFTPLLPTELPPATSTPVIYTVRAGDTLLGIAIAFGVEVADLQAVNNGVDPRALQIGQQLVIPAPRRAAPGDATPAFNLLPTATPLPLALVEPTCYAYAGGLVCLGAVQNTLAQPIERVAALVRLARADGTPLAEAVGLVEQRLLPVGNFAPYRAQFPPGVYGDYTVGTVLLSADAAENSETRFVALDVLDEQAQRLPGRYLVTARVRNNTQRSALAVRAVLTVRGGDGRVLGYRVSTLRETLLPGEETPLRIEVMPQQEDARATHLLYVEAQRAP
ncbi:MAG: LysM peptidoglycan-binding domain-containing protein [Chloroflexi bacterium]|nr:LysM peptidoglycan-binding domain-containing protein [Chloroflexota bacterium]